MWALGSISSTAEDPELKRYHLRPDKAGVIPSLTSCASLPTAQLSAGIAEWPALGVRGSSSTTAAAGGARELPAGPAPVQLTAKVSRPQNCRNNLPDLDWVHQEWAVRACLAREGYLSSCGSLTKRASVCTCNPQSEISPSLKKREYSHAFACLAPRVLG